jgi:predicted RNA-binding Zn-ribbon protein involved in translation (DUF1610 family)
MDPAVFESVEPLLDEIAEVADRQLGTADFRRLLEGLGKALGEGYTISVNLTVEVSDQGRGRSLPLLNTGLATSQGQEPYRTWGDSSPQRYVVGEGIRVVPHDRCPACWKEWDFKFQQPTCPHCGTTLGKDCRVLLDTDECPNCQEGEVTVSDPRCDECGFVADPNTVIWG